MNADYYLAHGVHPNLWQGIQGAWLPSLGNTGNKIPNQVGNGGGPAYGVGGTDNRQYWAFNSSTRGGRQLVAQSDSYYSYWLAPFRMSRVRQCTISLWATAQSVVSGTPIRANTGRNLFTWGDPVTMNAAWAMQHDNVFYQQWLDGAWRNPGGFTLWSLTLTHFALTWGPGRVITVYADGEVILSHTLSGSEITASNEPTHMIMGTGYSGLCGGGWDDLRTYSRALSASEIQILSQRPGIAYEVATRQMGNSITTTSSSRYCIRKAFSRIVP